MKRWLSPAIVVLALAATSCAAPDSTTAFRLPDGDTEAGRRAFWYLRCTTCHDIEGTRTPASDVAESAVDVRVMLGGPASDIDTYDELLTAIVNPSHELAAGYRGEDVAIRGRSIMDSTYINQIMTVQDLVDIMAFLQPVYEVAPPGHDPYGKVYD